MNTLVSDVIGYDSTIQMLDDVVVSEVFDQDPVSDSLFIKRPHYLKNLCLWAKSNKDGRVTLGLPFLHNVPTVQVIVSQAHACTDGLHGIAEGYLRGNATKVSLPLWFSLVQYPLHAHQVGSPTECSLQLTFIATSLTMVSSLQGQAESATLFLSQPHLLKSAVTEGTILTHLEGQILKTQPILNFTTSITFYQHHLHCPMYGVDFYVISSENLKKGSFVDCKGWMVAKIALAFD